MGLFSSRTVTRVATSANRVVDDDHIPNSVQKAIVRSLHEDTDIFGGITQELMTSVGVKGNRLYNYGETDYVYGNPTGELLVTKHDTSTIESALRSILNKPNLTVAYSRYGAINFLHLAYKHLIEKYNYDSLSGRITGLEDNPNFPKYVSNISFVVPSQFLRGLSQDHFTVWSDPPQAKLHRNLDNVIGYPRYFTDEWATGNRVFIQIQTQTKRNYAYPINGQTEYWSIDPNTRVEELPLPDLTKEYFHVSYLDNNKEYFWIYEKGAGTYPILDHLIETPPTQKLMGQFFPFAYFRYDKSSMKNLEGTHEYESTEKLLDYLGMDLADIIDAVHENPDIDDVQQAMMMFVVPANTQNQLELDYLHTFFAQLANVGEHQFKSELNANINAYFGGLYERRHAIEIKDKRFRMALSHGQIFKRLRAGRLGKIGHCSFSYESVSLPHQTTPGQNVSLSYGYDTITESRHIYRKQISTGVYEEIVVTNLQTKYHIYGSHSTLGDEQDNILLVPLDYSIIKEYSIPDREKLYSRSLHFIFNSLVQQKVKWYESGFFGFILMVIAIIIMAYTGAPTIAALQAGTLTAAAVLVKILYASVKALVISVATRIIADVVGVEIAMVLALLVAAYGFYEASSTPGGLKNAPWASTLLDTSVGLVKGASTKIQSQILEVQGEISNFLADAEQAWEDLRESQKLLETDSVLSPFVYLGESPDNFYNRTIHSGNLGVVSIQANSYFVENALRLPEAPETLNTFRLS